MSEKWKKILLIVAIVALIEFSGYGIIDSLFRLIICVQSSFVSIEVIKIKLIIKSAVNTKN